MKKLITMLLAGAFAATVVSPVALAQDKKKEQVHKGTPEQGTVQKKEQQKAAKKDGSGKKKAEEKK